MDEACANVIEHAYGSDTTREVLVKAIIEPDALRIRVVDTGRGFDPTSVRDADVDSLIQQRRSGGLGMRLIKSLMDEVHYEIVPGEKNELAMTKLRKK